MKGNAYLPLVAMLVLPLAILLSAYFLFFKPSWSYQADNAYASQLAELRAQALTSRLSSVSAHVDGLSRLAELRTALLDADTEALDNLSVQYHSQISHTDQLRFIPIGDFGVAGFGSGSGSFRSNIELDIVRKSIKDKTTSFDVHQVEGKYLLGFARAVFANERPIGVVLLSVSTAWLDSFIDDVSYGSREWKQSVLYKQGSDSVPLASSTVNAVATAQGQGKASASLSSNNSIEFAIDKVKDTAAYKGVELLLALAVTMLLVSALGGLRFLSRSLKQLDELTDKFKRTSNSLAKLTDLAQQEESSQPETTKGKSVSRKPDSLPSFPLSKPSVSEDKQRGISASSNQSRDNAVSEETNKNLEDDYQSANEVVQPLDVPFPSKNHQVGEDSASTEFIAFERSSELSGGECDGECEDMKSLDTLSAMVDEEIAQAAAAETVEDSSNEAETPEENLIAFKLK